MIRTAQTGRMLRIAIPLLLAAVMGRSESEIPIGVFGLFHPTEIAVGSAAGGALVVNLDGDVLAPAPSQPLSLRAEEDRILCRVGGALRAGRHLSVSGIGGLELSVPGKIQRRFEGSLEVSAAGGELIPVVRMECETLVASIVAAELSPRAGPEALKAQAVVARSYLAAARTRHRVFRFCDTTHCQFLREPPPSDHPASQAAAATAGLELTYQGEPIAALYSQSCGGRTRSLEDIGLSREDYPFFAVDCPPCRRHAESWERQVAEPWAESLLENPGREAARLGVVRRLGWSTVPSNNYRA
jgi:stage II sporulation protein D